MVNCTLAMICIMWVDPVLAVRLTQMGITEDNAGFVFAIIGFSFGFGAPIAGAICESMSRPVVMQLGLFFIVCAILMTGPSQLLGFPDVSWLLMIGIFFIGFFGAFIFVPITPEIIGATSI